MNEQLREKIAILSGQLCRFGGCDAHCEECGKALAVAEAILTAISEAGYLCVGKETVKAMMAENREVLYPCADCGKLRTKAEGGTVFTICEACWQKGNKKDD